MIQKNSVSVPLKKVAVRDKFFTPVQNTVIQVTIPYQEQVLDDRIPGIEKSHAFENFRIAAGESKGKFYGAVFQDSDVGKWIEAASYSLTIRPDPALEARVDRMVDTIGKAQLDDGYLDTYFILEHPERRWQNLQESHELYCQGHMIEAGVSYWQATGKRKLLDISCRIADGIDRRFGPGKTRGIPGHPEIELALMRLYRATGEIRYRSLAKYFIDERGTKPDYFQQEADSRTWCQYGGKPAAPWLAYMQDHLPVRQQSTAEGHSVRCLYLFTAAADLAAETHDEDLYRACRAVWENIAKKRMYLTGGVGSTCHGEAFTIDYDLPNDTVYAETCASIALCFFTRRLLEIEADGRYTDVMERALYNGVLSGMQLDGKRFFYVNPLEVVNGVSGELEDFKHVCKRRPQWYACACCPPNLTRFLTSLGRYAWSCSEKSRTVYSHLYLGGSAEFDMGGAVEIALAGNYPWDGEISYRVRTQHPGMNFTLAVRIPGWCRNARLSVNGTEVSLPFAVKSGYAYLNRDWNSGDTVRLSLPMAVRRVYANPMVREDIGRVALMRGPLVYCAEQCDNGDHLHRLRLPDGAALKALPFQPDLLGGIVPIQADGARFSGGDALYTDEPPWEIPQKIFAVPYYAWGNRDPGEMRVWLSR